MITHANTVAVYVSSQQDALRCYTEKLGFEVRRNAPMGPGGNWIELAPHGAQSRIVIYPRAMMKGWEALKPSIVLGCADAQATYRELSARGVRFTQAPKKMPWGTFPKVVRRGEDSRVNGTAR